MPPLLSHPPFFFIAFRAVSVSAATGEGIPELMSAIDAAAKEYDENYLPEIKRKKARACTADTHNETLDGLSSTLLVYYL